MRLKCGCEYNTNIKIKINARVQRQLLSFNITYRVFFAIYHVYTLLT